MSINWLNSNLCFLFARIFLISLVYLSLSIVYAQDGWDLSARNAAKKLYTEGRAMIQDEGLTILDKGLMGDEIDIASGSIRFHHTFVSLPGNSDLSVSYGRTLSDMRGWVVDTPSIHTTVIRHSSENWQLDRCSGRIDPPTIGKNGESAGSGGGFCYSNSLEVGVPSSDYNQGLFLEIQGGDQKKLIKNFNNSYPEFSGGPKVSQVTMDNWRSACIDKIPSGRGEGFLVTSPEGVTYRFDQLFYSNRVATNTETFFHGSPKGYTTADYHPEEALMKVSEVMDIHGNWVKYEYNSQGHVTRIHSNDKREITIVYDDGTGDNYVVTANKRQWRFQIIGDKERVTLPDGTYWEIPYQGAISPTTGLPVGAFNAWEVGRTLHTDVGSDLCNGPDWTIPQTSTIKHPNGATASFTFQYVMTLYPGEQKYSYLLRPCAGRNGKVYINKKTGERIVDPFALAERGIASVVVINKTIVLPNGEKYEWRYNYEPAPKVEEAVLIPNQKWRVVTEPDGRQTRYWVNREITAEGIWKNGILEKVEVFAKNANLEEDSPLEIIENHYAKGHFVGRTQSYVLSTIGERLASSYNRYQTQQKITRNGVTYTTDYEYNTDPNSPAYSFGEPTRITRYSTLNTNDKRKTDYVYKHDKNMWLLNMVDTVTHNDKLFDQYIYNPQGQPTERWRFGQLRGTYTYHQSDAGNFKGRLATATDGLNQKIEFNDYYRGRPREIVRADGKKLKATVDDNGWVTSQTDARGTTFNYEYNPMGWRTKLDRPAPWSDTTTTYANLGSGIIQTDIQGPLRTITTRDGFRRPVLVQQGGTVGDAQQIYTKTAYDAENRVTFKSFPQSDINKLGDGRVTTYDVLGRVIEERQTVGPKASTKYAYLNDNKLQVTDANGAVTTTHYSGYSSPTDGYALSIASPEHTTTEMSYDAWGNLVTVRQKGSSGGVTVNQAQEYRYDDKLRLCAHIVPETGTQLFNYDVEDQLIAYAEGQPTPDGCGTVPSSAKVSLSYDALGQLLKTDYPDSTPDITRSYDPNGNLDSITRTGGAQWRYNYNALNLIDDETLRINGKTLVLNHNYNAQAQRNQLIYPSGRTVNFGLNALGQTTSVADYVSNAGYHPSGTLDALTLGNGMTYTTDINERQLPSRMYVQNPADSNKSLSDLVYSWDNNANVIRIEDKLKSHYTIDMRYDGLNRLTSADGYWGDGTLTYDSLGNIRSKDLGSQKLNYSYDANNRLQSVSGSNPYSFTYDNRGNVVNNGTRPFQFDLSNQLIRSNNLDFNYDGHGRRVVKTVDGKTTLSLYGSDGTLYYQQKPNGDHIDYLHIDGRLITTVESR